MTTKTYSGRDHTVSVFGVLLDGFSDGDVVTVKKTNPYVVGKVGVDGEGVLSSQYADQMYEITISLLATSTANAVLSAAVALAENGQGPIAVRNTRGADTFASPRAAISMPPEFKVAKEVPDNVWTFVAMEGVLFLGGATS